MKDFFSFLREVLAFFRETIGHPDPAKRTSVKTIATVMILSTVLLFVYNYGGHLVTAATTESPTETSILKENIELRIQVSKLTRENISCTRERDELFQSYGKLLSELKDRPDPPPPPRGGSFYDRLGEL